MQFASYLRNVTQLIRVGQYCVWGMRAINQGHHRQGNHKQTHSLTLLTQAMIRGDTEYEVDKATPPGERRHRDVLMIAAHQKQYQFNENI